MMPLITDRKGVLEQISRAREKQVAIPCFCMENRATTEAIVRAAHEMGNEFGLKRPPVIIGMTGAYPGWSNCGHVFSCENVLLGAHALINDVKLLTGPGSPYQNVSALLMLDHGQPDLDAQLLHNRLDQFSIVMYDCSHHPLDDNIRMTAQYVEQHGKEVVIEGAVDELKEATAEGAFDLTTVEQAERYLRETGVDLIVPNVGTEHRAAAAGKVQYHGERVREIRVKIGQRMVVHGTSSLGDGDLRSLPGDGIIKVNIWTILERKGGQAVARHVVRELGNILDEDGIRELHDQGYLSDKYFTDAYKANTCEGRIAPKLDSVTCSSRRDVWIGTVVPTMKHYYSMFGYERLKG